MSGNEPSSSVADRSVAPPGQYLTFHVAGDEYAIAILRVREIIRHDAITNVPGMPPWILGVLNLRGSVLPVVDLALKLGCPASAVGKKTCVVIVEVELAGSPSLMGILADSVSQVLDLGPGEIEPAPPFGTRARADYLKGMGKAGRRFVLILDSERVLSSDELLAASTAAAAPEAAPPAAEPHA